MLVENELVRVNFKSEESIQAMADDKYLKENPHLEASILQRREDLKIQATNSSFLHNLVKSNHQIHTSVREYICGSKELGSLLPKIKTKSKDYTLNDKFLIRI
jgi:hypothetical protein